MEITRQEILKIAAISKIAIEEEEIEPLIKQLQDVLNYAECVKQWAGELEDQPSNRNVNSFREDVVVSSDSQAILERSPEREDDYFAVPKILKQK